MGRGLWFESTSHLIGWAITLRLCSLMLELFLFEEGEEVSSIFVGHLGAYLVSKVVDVSSDIASLTRRHFSIRLSSLVVLSLAPLMCSSMAKGRSY